MTIGTGKSIFAALPEGFAPAEELRAALPAAAQQVAYVGVGPARRARPLPPP